MKTANSLSFIARKAIVAALGATFLNAALAGALDSTIDDFNDPDTNNLGIARVFVDDTSAGGQTRVQQKVDDGVLSANGEIVPPRGQPGWASTVLLLDPQGLPRDASAYEGIRLLVRVNEGNLSVSANSSEITNFDYHAAQVSRQSDGEFHEVRIPFSQMKRAWSEQTPLNTSTLTSLSLVAFDIQHGAFDFEVDEISFY
ncbi:MAG: hypothetical protein HKP21_09480 [Xanthomonadales bacterium]|nr:CIA30 family protein [Gammaproteobacteria bacterium]MBT8073926.1 CIA30 family protein [Gammaproteobacteria bacterium]NNK04774.1 hypothetical protein [Xanthomonadales bacterium]NNK98054.1 hypothetical protein [Xanthomonadales bacterium]